MKHCIQCVLEYEGEKFCTACGTELKEGKLAAALERNSSVERCGSCGRLFRNEERFCGGCGLPYGKATAGVFRFYLEEDVVEDDGLV